MSKEPNPAAGPTKGVSPDHNEDGDLAAALERYSRSYDEMQTVRLNPLKIIPVDQWTEETQVRGSAIVRVHDWKRYARYVHRAAASNERFAGQARLWWACWEQAQAEPSRAGPAPLVSREIEGALRMAAARRGDQAPMVARAKFALGDGGPAKTLDAVVRAILKRTGLERVVDGDWVEHGRIKAHMQGQDRKKASDYVAPSGRLASGGWIIRDGSRVVLTAIGASEGMERLGRERARKGH